MIPLFVAICIQSHFIPLTVVSLGILMRYIIILFCILSHFGSQLLLIIILLLFVAVIIIVPLVASIHSIIFVGTFCYGNVLHHIKHTIVVLLFVASSYSRLSLGCFAFCLCYKYFFKELF